MSSEGVVEARGLTKRYDLGELASLARTVEGLRNLVVSGRRTNRRFAALEDVSFDVHGGECVAVMGQNGSGKSTLLRIIGGITTPSAGHVTIRGRMVQGVTGSALAPDLTGRENALLLASLFAVDPEEIRSSLPRVADFAELADNQLDTPVKHYSTGMAARLSFASVLALPADIYLFDEVLAPVDDHFKAKAVEALGSLVTAGRAVLFVSHELPVVESVCTHGLWLARGTARAFGPIAKVAAAYTAAEKNVPSSQTGAVE